MENNTKELLASIQQLISNIRKNSPQLEQKSDWETLFFLIDAVDLSLNLSGRNWQISKSTMDNYFEIGEFFLEITTQEIAQTLAKNNEEG